MRPAPNERAEEMRLDGPRNSNCGFFAGKTGSASLRMQVSDGVGWDHVSVSLPTRCPSWEEMCWVKRLWFLDEEAVMQLHPAKSEHVNYHPFCLHLWRPQQQDEIERIRAEWGDEWPYGDLQSPGAIPLPDSILVGPKQLTAKKGD